MSGGKGGGSVDTSGLEQATREATQLQEQIYEQGREDFQPWYQLGTGSVNLLSDLLGVTGGSVQSRDDIYNDLLPQYTTQSTVAGQDQTQGNGAGWYEGLYGKQRYFESNPFTPFGDGAQWRPLDISPAATVQDSINYDGLNQAVDQRLLEQSETPDGFGSLLEKFDNTKFEEDAGYQFRQDEANKALERQMAAQGVTLGGAGFGEVNPTAYRGLQELNQGLASQEYDTAYNRYTQDQLNTFNMLLGASGQGSGVVGQQVDSANQYATNVGNLNTSLASAQLNADLQSQSGGGLFDSLLGAGTQLGAAYLSDARVKENIEYTHTENGHKMYDFNYIYDDVKYNGVMAQDVEKTHPDSVIEIDGVKRVYYDALGVEMRTV